jgi:hypothetical protein
MTTMLKKGAQQSTAFIGTHTRRDRRDGMERVGPCCQAVLGNISFKVRVIYPLPNTDPTGKNESIN